MATTPRKPPLSVVKAGDKPASARRPVRKAAPARKVETAAKRSQRDGLVALRDRLGRAIDDPNTHPRDLANLARQQIAITEKIAAIDAAGAPKKAGNSAVATTADEAWDESAVTG